MSTEAMALALHHSRAKGTDKVVLLGIANHDGDGGSWPAHATLSVYANVDVRNVRRAIDNLEAAGEVRVHVGDGGTRTTPDWQRTNRYEVLLRCPPNCDGSTKHTMYCIRCRKPLGPDEKRAGRDTHDTPKGKEPCAPSNTGPRFSTGGAETPPPVIHRGGGDAQGGRAQTPTEPSINHPSYIEIRNTVASVTCARAYGRPHDFTTDSGRCAWCGLREDEL